MELQVSIPYIRFQVIYGSIIGLFLTQDRPTFPECAAYLVSSHPLKNQFFSNLPSNYLIELHLCIAYFLCHTQIEVKHECTLKLV